MQWIHVYACLSVFGGGACVDAYTYKYVQNQGIVYTAETI